MKRASFGKFLVTGRIKMIIMPDKSENSGQAQKTDKVPRNPQSQRKTPATVPGQRRTTRKTGKGRHGGNR